MQEKVDNQSLMMIAGKEFLTYFGTTNFYLHWYCFVTMYLIQPRYWS